MPTLAIALVLVAAVLHAGWNVLLKTSGDTLRTAVRLQAIGTAVLRPDRDRRRGSRTARRRSRRRRSGSRSSRACWRRSYFVLPRRRRTGAAPLSLVYPLARGSAPLLAVAIGIVAARRAPRARWPWPASPACSSGSCSSPGRGGRSGPRAGPARRDRLRARDRRLDRGVLGRRPARRPRDRSRGSTARSSRSRRRS